MTNYIYQIETYSVGQLATNCYFVFDTTTKDAVVVDPGDDGNFIAQKIHASQLHLHAILLTHGHFDHMLGVYELQEIFHVPVYMDSKDEFLVDRMKESAQYYLHREIVEQRPKITPIVTKSLSFGTIAIDVISVPGHTPGGVAFVIKPAQTVITGDTLFARGSIGRTDFSYSRPLDLAISIQKLFTLPESYTINPGHGECSTVGVEKELYDNKNNFK